MPALRHRLFLSSTAEDLRPFREAVMHVGQRLGFEVVAMEEFGPDPRVAVDLCREKVQSADLFVGLYAHRYGFVPDGSGGVAITELEYEWAMARRPPLPVLALLVDDSVPWPPGWIEHGQGWNRLQEFKARLRRDHVIAAFSTPEQLREDLFVHLPKFLERAAPQPPPVEPALPRPPEPYVAHQYTLLQTAQVVGRRGERERLDSWRAGRGAAVLCVVAIGGMGKSALTWRWFHERGSDRGLAGLFWWSFYETDATFDRFVVSALAYCTGRSLGAVEALPLLDREQQLLAVLDREPFLLVLDGLERLLIAYSNLDFAHLSDDDLDRRTANAVADQLGLPQGFISQHRLRKTIDPRIGIFLRKLARIRAGRVLVTTRLFPSELQTVTGQALPGTEAWFLTGLQPDDAVALWRELGVSGDDPQLRALFARIDHYPLLIRALAGEVANYRPAPGDFARWQADHPDFDPFALPLVQAKSHVLVHAIGDLAPDARDVLHTVAAFRAPVEYATLAALFVTRREWVPQRLDGVLSDLEDRGLVGWDRGANTYDLHPIVRGVVWNGLDDVTRRVVYGTLEEHFSAVPAPAEKTMPLAHAHQAIELFTALVGLERYTEATDLYFDRLHSGFSFHEHGMIHVKLAMLTSLFPDGLDNPPAGGGKGGAVLAQLSHAYWEIGEFREAYRLTVRMFREDPNWRQYWDFLAERAFKLGHVGEALHHAEGFSKPDHQGLDVHYRARWAELLVATGDRARGLAVLSELPTDQFFSPHRHEARIRLLCGEHERALALERQIREYAYFHVSDLMPLAEARVALGRAAEVVDFLVDGLRTARSQGVVEAELECLLLLAESHRRLGDSTATRSYLDDLADPAGRGPYRYIQAKAAVVLSELERDENDELAAVAAAERAYRLAWCDGPPYTYYWILRRAEHLLRELGAPVPELSR